MANNQAYGNKEHWAVRIFFISNQLHQLANIEHLHLAEMIIADINAILWEAEKAKWLTSIICEEAQYGVVLRPNHIFKVIYPERNVGASPSKELRLHLWH